MNKYLSLIRASMNEDMSLFKIKTKNKSALSKILIPLLLAFVIMSVMYSYSMHFLDALKGTNMEFVLLSLFVAITSIMTLIEGIYKSSGLIFNCKDDNLLLSLPISKSVVVFIRILKFYIFELLYNSLFLLPAIVLYGIYMKPDILYYIVSIVGILLFPIIPIMISCILGSILVFISSKFKYKNVVQTIITFIFLLFVLYFSYNAESIISNFSENAENINNIITAVCYPAKAYVELILDFNILKFLHFIIVHIIALLISIFLIGRVYFKINSNSKSIKKTSVNKNYVIKKSKPIWALIKKEFNRFINSPVFVTNAGFGLILFLIGSIFIFAKYDETVENIALSYPTLSIDLIKNNISIIIFGLISICSFTTSITSSMISLEGTHINILKSLPIKSTTVIWSKVLAAFLIMIPFFLIGDLLFFIKFDIDIIGVLLIILASILFPLISETIGILVNLKYPKMNANNDTEVVKQSISSAISVFVGMILAGTTVYFLISELENGVESNIILGKIMVFFGILYLILLKILHKTASRSFKRL